MFDGILLVDKPKGWTSHDVVAKLRGVLKQQAGKKVKIGHTGTLDPLATGLMIVVVGSYCKRAEEFSKVDKTYEVTMKLGETSTTGDDEGEKTITSTNEPFTEEVQAAAQSFVGVIEQVPPAFSAIKVGGKRAYELAREGKPVDIQPRQVKIHFIKGVAYDYPNVSFTTSVSSGTYIRTLVEDIGKKLEVGSHMTDLRRTVVGDFLLENAETVDSLVASNLEDRLQRI